MLEHFVTINILRTVWPLVWGGGGQGLYLREPLEARAGQESVLCFFFWGGVPQDPESVFGLGWGGQGERALGLCLGLESWIVCPTLGDAKVSYLSYKALA